LLQTLQFEESPSHSLHPSMLLLQALHIREP
jgi:hypothetical protein